MNAIVDRKIVQECGLILGVSIVAVFVFADVARPMREYEDLKTLVAEIEADINNNDKKSSASTAQATYLDRLRIVRLTCSVYELPQILALIDELEREIVTMRRPTGAVKKKASRMELRKSKRYMKSLGRA